MNRILFTLAIFAATFFQSASAQVFDSKIKLKTGKIIDAILVEERDDSLKIIKDGKVLFLSMTEILSYTKSPAQNISPETLFHLSLSDSTRLNLDSLNAKMREENFLQEIREIRKTLDEIQDASRTTAISTAFLAIVTAVGLICSVILVLR